MFSRRSFIAGVGSLGAFPARAADTDVVIVGAGAAGLAAARTLQRLQRGFVIVEARPRIGGRVHTDASLGPAFEAGAFYIHWAERNPWTGIARDLGVNTVDDGTLRGGFAVFQNGEPVPEAERGRRRLAFSRISTVLGEFDHRRDASFAEIVAGREPELATAAAAMALMSLGEEPDRVSAADYDQLDSGTDLVPPTGYGNLVARYGEGLPVSLSTVVRAIDWSGSGVRIETGSGVLRARAAIVTVPVGVLAREAIRFTPVLPAATRDAIGGLGMGAMTKLALRVDGERLGAAAFTQYFDESSRHELINFEFWPFDADLVVATFGGDYARGVARLGETAAIDHVSERLLKLTGAGVRKAIRAGRLAGWSEDAFAGGSYSVARPGHADARLALAQPVGERLWFAGEASAGAGSMTAGGAALAGMEAARQVNARLGRGPRGG